jgi:hypothetical protein
MRETVTSPEIEDDDPDAECPDECSECGEELRDDESKHDRWGQAYCPDCWKEEYGTED